MKYVTAILLLVLASLISAAQLFADIESDPVMQIISGNSQTVMVNTAMQDFVIRLTQNGVPIKNHVIQFKLKTGQINFAGKAETVALTNENGEAHTSPTMGKTAYLNSTIAVTAQNLVTTCTFTCSSIPDAADSIVIQTDVPRTGLQNQLLGELKLKVIDKFKNPIRNCPVTFQLKNGECYIDNLPSIQKTTDTNGSVTANLQLGNRLVESQINIQAQEKMITLVLNTVPIPSTPDLKLSQVNAISPMLPDGNSPSIVTVFVRNELDMPLSQVPVFLTSSSAHAKLVQQADKTDYDGKISAEITCAKNETVIISAYVTSAKLLLQQQAVIEFDTKEVKFFADNPTALSGTVGMCLLQPIQVKMLWMDKPVANQRVTFSSTASDASFGSGKTLQTFTDTDGIARAYFTCGKISGTQILYAQATILPDPITIEVYATPGPVASLTSHFSETPVAMCGKKIPMPLVVSARDQFLNLVPNASITFSALDDGKIISAQPTVSNSLGQAQADAELGARIGLYTFKAQAANAVETLIFIKGVSENTPPQIAMKNPAETIVRAHPGEILQFSVFAMDLQNDSLTYKWLVNEALMATENKLVLYIINFSTYNSVKCIISDGMAADSVAWELQVLADHAVEETALPTTFQLYQNFPNPFNAYTWLQFDCPRAENIVLEIWDANGRKVAEPANGYFLAGQHKINWQAENLASGVYILRFISPSHTAFKKMVYLQ